MENKTEDSYMYIKRSDCICRGVDLKCAECEYRDLWRKAKILKLDKWYKIPASNTTANRMFQLFGKECNLHPRDWKIEIVGDSVARVLIK